jgi:ubiquinone/menaquinone biosynthesis C-methylase UbiE
MEIERYTPGLEGQIWYEHWHRYHFAAAMADGLRVLDIACGEGYGAALLAGRAASVAAVDVNATAVAAAKLRYAGVPRLEFLEGRCEAIPLPDAAVDLVVSFETLEHIADPKGFVTECARVLAPPGMLLVSTPNLEVTAASGYSNPFHVREFRREEFLALLHERFPAVELFGQRVDAYSAIWPIAGQAREGQLLDVTNAEAARPRPGVADPAYFIALCGRDAQAVARAAGAFSLLSDREHWIWRDYAAALKRAGELQAHAERIEAAYLAAQAQIAALARERDRLLARINPPRPTGTTWRMG